MHASSRRRASGPGRRSSTRLHGSRPIDGLEGLSIGQLADATGMSKSGLYAHFGSKLRSPARDDRGRAPNLRRGGPASSAPRTQGDRAAARRSARRSSPTSSAAYSPAAASSQRPQSTSAPDRDRYTTRSSPNGSTGWRSSSGSPERRAELRPARFHAPIPPNSPSSFRRCSWRRTRRSSSKATRRSSIARASRFTHGC